MQEQTPRTTARLHRPRRISVFDGQDLKRAMLEGAAWLEEHREAINALNVFPVPDGDTGSNMSATMQAAIRQIQNSEETSAGVIAAKLAHGALLGARGNSGVILSQTLRGLAQGLDKKETFIASDLAAALQEASRLAYRAVIKPVEGTILTVVRESAEAAQKSAQRGDDLVGMMQEVVTTARQSVANTPTLLPLLKQAGVVDAGGQGYCTLLEGIWRYVRGEAGTLAPPPLPTTPLAPASGSTLPGGQVSTINRGPTTSQVSIPATQTKKGRVTIEEEFGYEVVFLLRGEKLDIARIRQTIIDMGGVSTVVAGDEKMLKVHTHTQTPGKILDYGVSLGSLLDINIENLQEQSLAYAAESEAEHAAEAETEAASTLPMTHQIATVAVAAGPGFEKVFRELGVSAIVAGGQTMNPSTEELLAAVNDVAANQVMILPNNGNVILSAGQVPGFNFHADFSANCNAMTEAAKKIQTVEITTAVRSVHIAGVRVREGDYIGLINGNLAVAGQTIEHVIDDTLQRLHIDRYEIVTLYYGEDVTLQQAQETAKRIKSRHSQLEIDVVDGGQPYYAYILSAE